MVQKKYFKTKDYCKVKFVVEQKEAESVKILGLNNDWKTPIDMTRKKDGIFTCDVTLPKDLQHQFRYLVNGSEWINEPEADAYHPNGFGTDNSVIVL